MHMTLHEFKLVVDSLPNTPRMPVIFVGHGSPMNGIENNKFTHAWYKLGSSIPRPAAILSISAHWLTEGTFVHAAQKPKTIHDFWGFPKALYNMTYPCPGSPTFAEGVQRLVGVADVASDLDWGIDHGTWIVLARMYPDADIPVFQLSLDISRSAEAHYELGRELAALRDKGVLIMGSGNIVHNLGRISFEQNAPILPWAEHFDTEARKLIIGGDHKALIHYEKLGHEASLAIPTPDHYWPLLYTLALHNDGEDLAFPVEGIVNGSISMRAVKIG